MQNTYQQQEKVTSHTVVRNPHSYRTSFKEPVVQRLPAQDGSSNTFVLQ